MIETLIDHLKKQQAKASGRGRLLRLAALAFVIGLSGAMMPGPMLAATIQQTAIVGMVAVAGILVGHALVEIVFVLMLAMGFRSVLQNTITKAVIGWVGGAALIYMGFDMMRVASQLRLDLSGTGTGAYSFPALILMGAAISLANPYFTGWWATVGAGQVAVFEPRGAWDYLVFYLAHESSDIVWFSLVGLLTVTGKQWITDELFQGLILICGALLAVIGVGFILVGWRLLRNRTCPEPAASV